MKKPRLFISHAWAYNDKYYGLFNLLNKRPYFDFYNHSVPEHDPLDFKSIKELKTKLENQIKGCQVVIVIAGIYPTYRKWIQEEIGIALRMNKPIIGVYPWGQTRATNLVKKHANSIVRWDTESIIAEIRKYT